jgi:hypothetical protein
MKLIQRYLFCVVALLLLFSAYCKPVLSSSHSWIIKAPLMRLPDSHPSQYRLKVYFDPPTFSRRLFSQNESLLLFAGKRSSPGLRHHVPGWPIYAAQNRPLINENHLNNYQIAELNASIIYKEKKERTGFGRGAAIGALIGAGIGGIVGFAGGTAEGDFISPGAYVLGGMIIGAAVGVIIGGIIGAATKKRKAKL